MRRIEVGRVEVRRHSQWMQAPGFRLSSAGKHRGIYKKFTERGLTTVRKLGYTCTAQHSTAQHSTAQVGHILSLSLSVAIFYLYKKRVALAGCRYNRHIRPMRARFLLPESLCMRTKWYIVPPANAPPHRAPAGRADALTGLSASH